MDDATEGSSRVTVPPDGLVIDVDAAHAVAPGMLSRAELPEGAAPETTFVDQEHTMRVLLVGFTATAASVRKPAGAYDLLVGGGTCPPTR